MIDEKCNAMWTTGQAVSPVHQTMDRTDEEIRWYAIESAILTGKTITQAEYDFYCTRSIVNNWPMTTIKPNVAGWLPRAQTLDKAPKTVYGKGSEANKVQYGGDHYKQFSKVNLEPWDVINAWGLGYFDGNALKYIARWGHKNGVEDLKKAVHYLQKLIEIEESK